MQHAALIKTNRSSLSSVDNKSQQRVQCRQQITAACPVPPTNRSNLSSAASRVALWNTGVMRELCVELIYNY